MMTNDCYLQRFGFPQLRRRAASCRTCPLSSQQWANDETPGAQPRTGSRRRALRPRPLRTLPSSPRAGISQFFHDVHTGDNVWILPPRSRIRSATLQAQALLDGLETTQQPQEPEATDWVIQRYGILHGPYFYSCSLGRVQSHPPPSLTTSAATSSQSGYSDAA